MPRTTNRAAAANPLYDLLFADDPGKFKGSAADGQVAAADPDVATLRRVAGDPKAESRLRILAFRRLAGLGATIPGDPPFLGVIVEMGLPEGLDVLAAYADGRIRYLNRSGRVLIVEDPAPFAAEAAALLEAAAVVGAAIGPWAGPRRPPATIGTARVTFLMGGEIRFGEGPLEVLQADAAAGHVIAAATRLLQALVARGLEATNR